MTFRTNPNGNITINKIKRLLEEKEYWNVYGYHCGTVPDEDTEVKINTEKELYDALSNGMNIEYEFIGNWGEYMSNYRNQDNIVFEWRKDDYEITIKKDKENKIHAELVKYQNNEPLAETMPTCYSLGRWIEDKDGYFDFAFYGNRIDDIDDECITSVMNGIKMAQNVLYNYSKSK